MPRQQKNQKCDKCQDWHDEICCPTDYKYKYDYCCDAKTGNFQIWREKTDCPCCPTDYKYKYTVKVHCIPSECIKDDCKQPKYESSTSETCESRESSEAESCKVCPKPAKKDKKQKDKKQKRDKKDCFPSVLTCSSDDATVDVPRRHKH